MKKAEKTAREAKGLRLMLNTLFQRTFTVAKEVRTATEIGAHSVSMAAAAVRLANRLFGQLTEQNVLFVGAGEMIELCAAHFAAQDPKSMTVANRSLDRGQALAEQIGGRSMRLADLPSRIAEFDINYSEGISRIGSLLDVAADLGILEKRGSWFSFEGEQLGQGREQTKALLESNDELAGKITAKVREKLAGTPAADNAAPADAPAGE